MNAGGFLEVACRGSLAHLPDRFASSFVGDFSHPDWRPFDVMISLSRVDSTMGQLDEPDESCTIAPCLWEEDKGGI